MISALAPLNKEQLKSWLGLINYYRRFISNFAATTSVLNDLLKDKVKCQWGDKQNKAFDKVKKVLCSASVLVHYDPKLPIVVESNASPTGLGAVISHILHNEEEKQISFASRTLRPTEQNYSQIEKGAIGIVFAVQKFHVYLYG